jgi:predicted secreted hydrolase
MTASLRWRLAGLTLAALALAATGAGANPQVRLPRDHFGHPSAGIEWWYVTGAVKGSDGHRYSVFFTLFKRGAFVLPASQVVDLSTGEAVGHTETVSGAIVDSAGLDVRIPNARLRFTSSPDTWRFAASGPGYGLDLVAVPTKPYTLHGGGTGYVHQSVAGRSAYYSATRMTARGRITKGAAPIPFTGEAWLDHQWGSFQDDPRAFNWDWFSCRFDDRTELMLYRFRTRTGAPLPGVSTGTVVPRSGRARLVPEFDAEAGERSLVAAGHRWPLAWRLSVPSEKLTLRLRSVVRDQLVRGTVLPTFWEGVATATGTKTGTCFVEQSHR